MPCISTEPVVTNSIRRLKKETRDSVGLQNVVDGQSGWAVLFLVIVLHHGHPQAAQSSTHIRRHALVQPVIWTKNQCWGSRSECFGPPRSRSVRQRYGSRSGSFPFLIKVLADWNNACKIFIFKAVHRLKTEDNVPAGKSQEKNTGNFFFCIWRKELDPESDPDPHQNNIPIFDRRKVVAFMHSELDTVPTSVNMSQA